MASSKGSTVPLRILAFAPTLPRPDRHSGDRRYVALLELLAQHHHVDLFLCDGVDARDEGARGAGRRLAQAGVRVLDDGWVPLARATAWRFYHVALFEFFHTFEEYAWIVRQRQPGARLVIDSVDVHFAREQAGERLGIQSSTPAALTRERELAAYRAADAVIAVTDADADVLRREGRMPPVFVLPNIVDIRPRSHRQRPASVIFVGGFRHAPNVDAVLWFVTDVWPRIRQAVPTSMCYIAGSSAPPEILSLADVPGVRVLGYVPDTASVIDEASVSIAPLRYGAGMKGKVNEAFACGIPLVTTSVGIQGIPAVAGVHAAIADSAADFAAAVIHLLNDRDAAQRMGAAGQTLARNYTPDRIACSVDQMLRQVVPQPDAVGLRLQWLTAQLKRPFRIVSRAAGPAPPVSK